MVNRCNYFKITVALFDNNKNKKNIFIVLCDCTYTFLYFRFYCFIYIFIYKAPAGNVWNTFISFMFHLVYSYILHHLFLFFMLFFWSTLSLRQWMKCATWINLISFYFLVFVSFTIILCFKMNITNPTIYNNAFTLWSQLQQVADFWGVFFAKKRMKTVCVIVILLSIIELCASCAY